ncbi:MAG: DNA adenine methylase [Spirochaetaceae bacterium]|jgi:adenine-specific DNA-methyltransferase|nr:DNA adenine methylase [Spirochaetaceae bacterium]
MMMTIKKSPAFSEAQCCENGKTKSSNYETENSAYLSGQLITCIGNKRKLLPFIGNAVELVRARLGKSKLAVCDLFSGSGIVARFFKQYASLLIANDLEEYSQVINTCYLSNASEIDTEQLAMVHENLLEGLKEEQLSPGFISRLYAPASGNIRKGERVFYTPLNARYLDTARALISGIDRSLQPCFIAPLLSEASVHANTSGVFKGFYKNRDTGIGKFGGRRGDALSRITGRITLPFPVFSRFECEYAVYRDDANILAAGLPELDIAYIDPPYNQHPYGSNYFMLNLIASYREPSAVSRVSGIPPDWNRSDYNRPSAAADALRRLAETVPARFLLISFNSEGFIGYERMVEILDRIGTVTVIEIPYNTFRGSRNLNNRAIHVTEYLYLVEKRS